MMIALAFIFYHGNYIFNIKSASGDQQSEVSSIRIKVLRPFWTQPLLLVAYTLLILTNIGFIIYQYMSIRKEKRHAELIQAEKEKNELGRMKCQGEGL